MLSHRKERNYGFTAGYITTLCVGLQDQIQKDGKKVFPSFFDGKLPNLSGSPPQKVELLPDRRFFAGNPAFLGILPGLAEVSPPLKTAGGAFQLVAGQLHAAV